MALQNYAKFESSISSANKNIIEWSFNLSWSNYRSTYNDGLIYEFFNMVWDIIGFLIISIIVIGLLFGFFFFLYVIVSLFTKWWVITLNELKTLWNGSISFFKSTIYCFLKKSKWIISYIWNKKIISILLILFFISISFWKDVINGNSRLLKLEKINPWYVWVDLINSKLLYPGYHLYSPIKSSVFLSPTNDFTFQIAEITANTKEELGVTLDYKVGFKLVDDKRLDFYNKFWTKDIRLVSSEIVMPRLLEVIKWTIKNYSFKDISSQHNEIKKITIAESNKSLKELGIVIQDITILDIRLPKSYLYSQEELLKAENGLKLAEAKLEAQKKESEKRILEAQSQKDVKIIEAEALAEYNKIINSQSITDSMLEMKRLENDTMKIKKWNGILPSSVGDNLDF